MKDWDNCSIEHDHTLGIRILVFLNKNIQKQELDSELSSLTTLGSHMCWVTSEREDYIFFCSWIMMMLCCAHVCTCIHVLSAVR